MSNTCPVVPRLESPTFLVLAYDIADTAQALKLRDDFMEGHLSHTEANWTRYVTAGPMRTDDGQGFVGSMFLVRGTDKADVETLMKGDPYFRCGLYGRVEIVPAVAAIGTAIGGRIWTDAARLKSNAVAKA